MSKGCGCQTGIFKWLKPPYAKKFYVPCVMHDDDYDKGGTEKERKAADITLYFNILRLIVREPTNPLEKTWMFLIALFYYMSVRVFGRFYFNYK
jgi:hypothetical protein